MFAADVNYDDIIKKDKRKGEHGPVYQVTVVGVQL